MKLEKTREALSVLGGVPLAYYKDTAVEQKAKRAYVEAQQEVQDAESLLREAAALKVFAAAGLSAFHGRLCSMASGAYPENASECADPKCRAWAKAVQGEAAEDAWSLKARVEFLEEREKHIAAVLDVADGGQYRNDWDGAVERLKCDARNAALEEAASAIWDGTCARCREPIAWDPHGGEDGQGEWYHADNLSPCNPLPRGFPQAAETIRALKRGG